MVRDLDLDQDQDIPCGQVARTPTHSPTHSDESCTPSGVMTGRYGEMLISPRPPMNTPTSSLASDEIPPPLTPPNPPDLERLRVSWSAPPTLIKHAYWTQPPRQFPADPLDHQVVKDYIKSLEVSIFKKMDSLFFSAKLLTYMEKSTPC
jgi:hypothetical protein